MNESNSIKIHLNKYSSIYYGASQAYLPANAGDVGLMPGLGRSLGGRNGNPLQYSCTENSMDRGAWWAIVHGVTELYMTEHMAHTKTLMYT